MKIIRKQKQAITLLEIMIVIFLIGIIGSVIGYNMKGSLDEGRAFRTEQAANQIHDILLLEVAKGRSMDNVLADAQRVLKNSGLVKDVNKMLKDGWGVPFDIKSIRNGTDIGVYSERLKAYKLAKNRGLEHHLSHEEENVEDTDNE